MSSTINIKNRKIGTNEPVFIIAEVGVNHNGDLNLAKDLIKQAKELGADCVKFQTFKAKNLVTKKAIKAKYQVLNDKKSKDKSQFEMLKKLELSQDSFEKILKHCTDNDIIFISTPYNYEDVEFLESYDVPAYKLSSMHSLEPSFANYVAKKGKPIILSTGMSSLDQIKETVEAINITGNKDLALLQCTTSYPSKISEANLKTIKTLEKNFNTIVGFSDHTLGHISAVTSVGLGAKIIEKHLTLDKNMEGPDHAASCNPNDFSIFVKMIRDAEKALGSGIKKPTPNEKENMQFMLRSICAKIDILKNTIINEKLLTFKRPGDGISPRSIKSLIGKKVIRNILADEQINWKDIEK